MYVFKRVVTANSDLGKRRAIPSTFPASRWIVEKIVAREGQSDYSEGRDARLRRAKT